MSTSGGDRPDQVAAGASRQLLVITGAGASVGLGVGDGGVPAMTEWADLLAADLDGVIPGSANQLGLVPGLPGVVFEEQLGTYLAYVEALRTITDRYVALGSAPLANQQIDSHGLRQGHAAWRRNADERNDLIMETIRANLYDNFGPRRIDSGNARAAYRALLSWFPRVDARREVLAIATTNYDLAIEIGLRMNGVRTTDGFQDPTGYGTPVLQPKGMAAEAKSNGVIPIIHLHGAVGWYRENGEILKPRASDQPYASGSDPALVLPDSTKTGNNLPGAQHLWDEFTELLSNATHVAFLGHSLHDAYLVDQVRRLSCKKAVFAYVAGEFTDTSVPGVPADDEQWIREQLGESTLVIPCHFGPEARTDLAAVRVWWDGVTFGTAP